MNRKLTALIALPLLLALTVTGCSSTIEPAEEVAGGAAPITEEEAPDESEEEAPAAEVGTRENPAPAGTVIEVKSIAGAPDYQVTIGAVNLNAAEQVANANMFNEPAPEGFQYIVFPVTYTYVGTETGLPWLDVTIEFVSAAGTTHTSSDVFTTIDSPLSDINELYPQASGTGNEVIAVPTADLEAGLLTISDMFSDKFFIKLA